MTDDDIALARALADAAGATIRPFFRAGVVTETKADASPVTQADRAAEAAMRRLLADHAPALPYAPGTWGPAAADAMIAAAGGWHNPMPETRGCE